MRRRSFGLLVPISALVLSACGADTASDSSVRSRPSIVATHSVLGAIVSDLVGDSAEVRVLIPNGVDPHEWEPSAKDVEAINDAALIVANGLSLEEGLESILDAAEPPVFFATNHVQVLEIGDAGHGEHGDDGHSDDEHGDDEHGDEGGDPHFWTDPLSVAEVVEHLSDELATLGFDVAERAEDVIADLNALDAEVAESLSVIPVEDRVMITGHVSMAYFAAHYDFELIGSIVPSLSTSAEATAANLSELKEAIEVEGVSVIFAELGAPDDVVEALANETGVRVVVVSSHLVPDDNTYRSFLSQLASEVRDALTA